MPATVNGGGDQLARGAVRATFRSPNVSQEKWDDIFGEDSGPKQNYEADSGDTDSEQAGTSSVVAGKTRKRKG